MVVSRGAARTGQSARGWAVARQEQSAGRGNAQGSLVQPLAAIGVVRLVALIDGVRGIDFEVKERECFGFLGPNGAGKTTTMKMISCISPPTGGRLDVLGMSVAERPRDIKRRTGVLPQEYNLDEEVSVLDNLIIYARYFDIPARQSAPRAEELLEFMALEDKRGWRIDRLSGGMKRRLMIARAPPAATVSSGNPATG